MLRFLIVIAAIVPLCAQPKGVAHIPLPADLSGTLDGTPYGIRVPANWNGTLLVWAHGSASGTLQVAPPTYPATSPTLEEQLLLRGYALAGSFYVDSEKEGPQKTLSLTNFFNGAVGNPRRTIVWGLSLGGNTALKLIEDHPGTYDGAIPVSAADFGELRQADDTALRYDVAYAAAFGWPTDWWGPLEDVRDDLYGNEATLLAPIFQWPNPGNYPQWEFIRLVMKESQAAWWDLDPSGGLPGWGLAGWVATAYRSHWQHLWGGPIAQNIGTVYSLTAQDKTYLSTLGVNVDALLGWMNAHTNITARISARNHLAHYGTFTGDLRRPTLTMHGILDPIVIVSNEAGYRGIVAAAGRTDMLVQVYVNTFHGPWSAEQYSSVLAAMEHWLETGIKPDASFFPASQGFDNSFVPPPWPH